MATNTLHRLQTNVDSQVALGLKLNRDACQNVRKAFNNHIYLDNAGMVFHFIQWYFESECVGYY